MRKKILFITPQPFFIERGSPYRVRSEVKAVVENGFDVDLLCYPFGKEISLDRVKIFRSFRPFWINKIGIGLSFNKIVLDFFLFFSALRLMLTNKYSLIHGVEDAGVIAAILNLIKKTPYIFDMHSHMSEQLSQCIIKENGLIYKIITYFENFCIKKSSGVITVSDHITSRIRFLCPKSSVITLEDLPLENSYNENSDKFENLKRKYCKENTYNIVYTGNFEPYQGIDLLVEGFSKFKQSQCATTSNKKLQLIVVGGGDDKDSRFISIKKLISSLDLDNDIILTGQRTEEEISGYLYIADFLISPRIAGAHTPLKIYSYIAASKPIIASKIAAHINVLNNNNSLLFEPTTQALANTLIEIANDEGNSLNKEELVTNALKLLTQRFNKKEFSRKLGLIYNVALGLNSKTEVEEREEQVKTRSLAN